MQLELFHTASGTAFADLLIDGHRETWPVRSTRFRAWLRRRYYEATGDAPSAAALNTALNLLEARAQFDGPERAVHVRVAEHDGHIYLDLADERWRAVEIGPTDGSVIAEPPVRFRRPAGMLPLAASAARRIARAARLVAQSAEPERFRPRGLVAVGSAATERPLSTVGHFRRTGIGQDHALEDAASARRSERRPGAGPPARRARVVHRRQ